MRRCRIVKAFQPVKSLLSNWTDDVGCRVGASKSSLCGRVIDVLQREQPGRNPRTLPVELKPLHGDSSPDFLMNSHSSAITGWL